MRVAQREGPFPSAAHFVQTVVAKYERHFAAFLESSAGSANSGSVDAEAPEGKETSNLIVLLSELYNFQVISCLLVYDVIRGLLEGDLIEFKVELLLKITRSTCPLSNNSITKFLIYAKQARDSN